MVLKKTTQDPLIFYLQDICFKYKCIDKLKVNRRKSYKMQTKCKNARVVILMSDKADLKTKSITRYAEEYCI